ERDAEVAPRAPRIRLPRLPDGSIDKTSPQFKAAEAAQIADMTREGGQADPLAGMSWLHKAAANMGAGMADVFEAGKQRLGMASAPTDADVREKRALDERLAEGTGGGKFLQVVGQAAPLLPVGLIPGMQGVAGGAALGALGGALQTTTDDESAGQNAAMGALVGGALPALGKVIGKGWRYVRGTGAKEAAAEAIARETAPELGAQAAPQGGRLQRAAQAVKDWATPQGAGPLGLNTAGAESAKPEMQRVAEALADQLRGVQPVEIGGIRVPQSTAAALKSDALTRIEQGGRVARPQNWAPFTRSQDEAYTNVLRGATGAAEDLPILAQARGDAWRKGMEEAMANADPAEFAAQAQAFRDAIAAHRTSPLAQRSGVRSLLSDAESAIEAAGDQYSPAHMLEYRTGLNQGYSSPAGRLTAKDAGITALKGNIDEALDAATGGRVTPVIRQFREASPAVDAAEAAANVRGAFFDAEGRPLTRVTHGSNPEITETRLRNIINAQADPRFGQQLAPDAERQLQALLDAIRSNRNVQQLNRVATPEGSATASNQFAAKANEMFGKGIRGAVEMKLGPVGKLATAGWDILANGTEAQRQALVDRAAQDPQFMRELMEQYAKSMGPTRSADAVLTALRQGVSNRMSR
ncbi:MAG TPA: hypothetical protein VK955_04640, partial [Xanthobacteraceae bacterium]|nr:hypothetical protein [Xanthobacteraceae bacterium]